MDLWMKTLFAVTFVLSTTSCAGPDRAYLARDWDRFVTECADYCSPEPSHPDMTTRPWVCGCPDKIEIGE